MFAVDDVNDDDDLKSIKDDRCMNAQRSCGLLSLGTNCRLRVGNLQRTDYHR